MSEINYFKVFYYTKWCGRWCELTLCERYKLMHDMTLDDIDILHVKRIKIIICSGSYKYKYTSSYHCVMLRDFKMSYIYVNSYIDLNYVKIVKFKITTLLHFFNNYMILTKNV
jgi:hypothetical protein